MLTGMTGDTCRPPPRPRISPRRFAARACLASTRVREVAVESDRTTILSRIIRLRLGYDGMSPAHRIPSS